MSTSKYASLASADLKEGSNLFDNVNAKVAGFKFTAQPPENYNVEGNPIFAAIDLVLDGDGPEEDRKVNQSYSLGAQAGDHFTIGDDGFGLVPNNDESTIRKDCKFGTFLTTLETMAGFPTPKLQAGDMSCLIGLYGHFKRIADKERNFGEDQRTKPNQKKSKFPPSTLCCTKVLALPGEAVKSSAPAGSAGTANTGSGQTSGTVAAAGDVDTQAMDFLTNLLSDKGSIQRSQLGMLISKAAMGLPNRADIAKRAVDEEFLGNLSAAGIVKYDPASKPQVVLRAA